MRFYEQLDRFGDSVALLCDDGAKYTYRQLETQTMMFAQRVYSPVRRVAFIIVNNCEQSVWGYLGFLRADVVPLLLGNKLSHELFERLIEMYHPTWIWAEEDYFCQNEQYRHGKYVLSKLDAEPYSIHPDLCMMLTTSGSTGSPKCVRQTKANLEINSTCAVEHLRLSQEECFMTTLPMNYTYGLMSLQSHLLAGARIIMNRHSVMTREFWQLLQEHKATSFAGVPFTYEMLRRMRFTSMDLPHLRYVTEAGGKMEKDAIIEVATALNKKGKDFIVLYGQTEGTCFMSYVPHEQQITKAGSIGVPFRCGEFSLVDEDGKTISGIGKSGELVFSGTSVCFGYAEGWQDLELGDVWNGYLPTGDIAQCDEDGFYTIVGRKKRFLKIHGERINLDEIEGLLRDRGIENVCQGRDDEICIYTTNEDVTAIRTQLNQLTGINRECLTVRRIPYIPRNESGKILYSELDKLI